jgi:hypothetical protein
VLQAYDEVNRVRDSIELYRAQPPFDPPEDFSAQVRELLASTNVLSGRGRRRAAPSSTASTRRT